MIAAPHVVVRIAEPVFEIAHTRLEEIAQLHGFEGRLVMLAEPGMALGDCRIEWADGGLRAIAPRPKLRSTKLSAAMSRRAAAPRDEFGGSDE